MDWMILALDTDDLHLGLGPNLALDLGDKCYPCLTHATRDNTNPPMRGNGLYMSITSCLW